MHVALRIIAPKPGDWQAQGGVARGWHVEFINQKETSGNFLHMNRAFFLTRRYDLGGLEIKTLLFELFLGIILVTL